MRRKNNEAADHRPTSPADPVVTLVTTIKRLAVRRDLRVFEQPEELSRRVTRSHHLAAGLGLPIESPGADDTDSAIGLLVGHYAVLIASFDGVGGAQTAPTRLAKFQRQAAIALTWLDVKERCDLNLFLVGPCGAAASQDWQDVAARIERDEQVCRKLVWLPTDAENGLVDSAERFCERTFLAAPWNRVSDANVVQLDPLAAISAGDPMFLTWLQIVEGPDDPSTSMADRLIQALRVREEGSDDVPKAD